MSLSREGGFQEKGSKVKIPKKVKTCYRSKDRLGYKEKRIERERRRRI